MRIYFADGQALSALRNSGISLILDIGNDQLANIAASTSNAASWVQNNVRPYYPAVNIKYIAAGNEVLGGATQSIVPAMRRPQRGPLRRRPRRHQGVHLDPVRRGGQHHSHPPPACSRAYMTDVARHLASTGAPLLANVYPLPSYRDNPRDISLNYATFQPGTTVRDQNNGLTYTCLFDAMVDAVYAALEKAGAPGVKVVISESGWPSAGGFAASPDNARTYNQGLINHVGGGTPKKREALETYIFAMFNENQKTGDPTERSFGLFNPDKSPAYAIQF
uniref:Glucan endo-1,3-beta-D-glucosidase n=1 Tax=Secale cereale TaxID=4550 RepID=Q1EMA0_SECCE|nr:glucan endo-1,3-beta-D-glucosidase [Secale cereale]